MLASSEGFVRSSPANPVTRPGDVAVSIGAASAPPSAAYDIAIRAARELADEVHRAAILARPLVIAVREQGSDVEPFRLIRGESADTVLLAIEGATVVLRAAQQYFIEAESAAVDVLVVIGQHEVGHAQLIARGARLGDRREQLADDYMLLASAQSGHLGRIDRLTKLLRDLAAPDRPTSVASRHGRVESRIDRIHRLRRAAVSPHDAFAGTWRDIENTLGALLRGATS